MNQYLLQTLFTWGMLLLYALLNSTGALLIKHKQIQLGEVHFDSFGAFFHYFVQLFSSFQVLAGFAAIILSSIAWMVALSKMQLTVAYPVAVGLSILVVLIFSILIHGEVVTPGKIAAIVLILLSLYLMN